MLFYNCLGGINSVKKRTMACSLVCIKVHLKSRGTDCKIFDHSYISQYISAFSFDINSKGQEVNFTPNYFLKNEFLQWKMKIENLTFSEGIISGYWKAHGWIPQVFASPYRYFVSCCDNPNASNKGGKTPGWQFSRFRESSSF